MLRAITVVVVVVVVSISAVSALIEIRVRVLPMKRLVSSIDVSWRRRRLTPPGVTAWQLAAAAAVAVNADRHPTLHFSTSPFFHFPSRRRQGNWFAAVTASSVSVGMRRKLTWSWEYRKWENRYCLGGRREGESEGTENARKRDSARYSWTSMQNNLTRVVYRACR